MTDETASLVLEILKRVQGDTAGIREDIPLIRRAMTAIRHDRTSLRGMQVFQGAEIGAPRLRKDRIERRLDLTA